MSVVGQSKQMIIVHIGIFQAGAVMLNIDELSRGTTFGADSLLKICRYDGLVRVIPITIGRDGQLSWMSSTTSLAQCIGSFMVQNHVKTMRDYPL